MHKKTNYLVFGLIIVVAIGVLYRAEQIAIGAQRGIYTCINSVIPSLYIFMVICIFAINSGLFSNNVIINIISKIVFGKNGSIGAVAILSLFCGYPVGCTLINQMYINKEINKKTATEMVYYCINPGPAFVISVVGMHLYGNKNIGYILLTSVSITAIITARFIKNKNFNHGKQTTEINYRYAMIQSVNASTKNIVIICGWVVLSAAILEMLNVFSALKPLLCLLEVTSGVTAAYENYSIYFVAFLLGFGGLCVILQALSAAKDVSPSFIKILICKLIQGFSTSVFTFILLKLFPQAIQTSKKISLHPSQSGGELFTAISVVAFLISTIIFIHQNLKFSRKL